MRNGSTSLESCNSIICYKVIGLYGVVHLRSALPTSKSIFGKHLARCHRKVLLRRRGWKSNESRSGSITRTNTREHRHAGTQAGTQTNNGGGTGASLFCISIIL
jgi:hypothetical protein